LIGTANFQAAEVTVWTRGSCQAVSPTAWERGYYATRSLETADYTMSVQSQFQILRYNQCRSYLPKKNVAYCTFLSTSTATVCRKEL